MFARDYAPTCMTVCRRENENRDQHGIWPTCGTESRTLLRHRLENILVKEYRERLHSYREKMWCPLGPYVGQRSPKAKQQFLQAFSTEGRRETKAVAKSPSIRWLCQQGLVPPDGRRLLIRIQSIFIRSRERKHCAAYIEKLEANPCKKMFRSSLFFQ